MSPDEGRVEVPIEAERSFEHVEGIPLDVVAELFDRAGFSAELQAAFWQEAAEKTYLKWTGKVTMLETRADGSTKVEISTIPGESDQVPASYFYAPPDLSDAQLETLKFAARAGRTVTISYQWLHERPKGGGSIQPVNSVSVWF